MKSSVLLPQLNLPHAFSIIITAVVSSLLTSIIVYALYDHASFANPSCDVAYIRVGADEFPYHGTPALEIEIDAEQEETAEDLVPPAADKSEDNHAPVIEDFPSPDQDDTYRETDNIALITLDTTRFDSIAKAKMPNLNKILERANAGPFRRVYSHGTFTLPSHYAMLVYGRMPNNRKNGEGIYNDLLQCLWSTDKSKKCYYRIPAGAPNIVKGFERMGYRTVGIGGTSWFNPRKPTSSFWARDFFSEFFYHYNNTQYPVISAQVRIMSNLYLKKMSEKKKQPLFFFLNIREMHSPYSAGVIQCLIEGIIEEQKCYEMKASPDIQGYCLDYVDQYWPTIFGMLPKPIHVIITGDHGDCFQDCMAQGFPKGHGFFHEKVLEVPMIHFMLREEHLA